MRSLLFYSTLILIHITGTCQNDISAHRSPDIAAAVPPDIIAAVLHAQASLKILSYILERTDTLVSGDTRTMRGRVLIKVDHSDSIFGFEFQARKEAGNGTSLYDGHALYETDDQQKTYTYASDSFSIAHAFYRYSGQIVFPDLVRLDTSGAINSSSWQDGQFIVLRLNYPDLPAYNVTKRSKTFTIDRNTLLPLAMRSHQESLGRVQDLYYHVIEIHPNDPSFAPDLSNPGFLQGYSQRITTPDKPFPSLKGMQAPAFSLVCFDGRKISSESSRSKLILLDFWELWCGPCVESMPKIQHLYDSYKDKGLQVYGITSDTKQLEPSRLMVQRERFSFPMLIGNEQLKKDYQVSAIPLYFLIDRKGKVCFQSQGYSDELEAAIKKALLE